MRIILTLEARNRFLLQSLFTCFLHILKMILLLSENDCSCCRCRVERSALKLSQHCACVGRIRRKMSRNTPPRPRNEKLTAWLHNTCINKILKCEWGYLVKSENIKAREPWHRYRDVFFSCWPYAGIEYSTGLTGGIYMFNSEMMKSPDLQIDRRTQPFIVKDIKRLGEIYCWKRTR